jgi:stress-induced morphogen
MILEDKDVIEAIQKSIPGAKVSLTSLDCSKKGYYIEVESALFKDQPLIDQHKKVKKALADFLNSEDLHAVTIKTKC